MKDVQRFRFPNPDYADRVVLRSGLVAEYVLAHDYDRRTASLGC